MVEHNLALLGDQISRLEAEVRRIASRLDSIDSRLIELRSHDPVVWLMVFGGITYIALWCVILICMASPHSPGDVPAKEGAAHEKTMIEEGKS